MNHDDQPQWRDLTQTELSGLFGEGYGLAFRDGTTQRQGGLGKDDEAWVFQQVFADPVYAAPSDNVEANRFQVTKNHINKKLRRAFDAGLMPLLVQIRRRHPMMNEYFLLTPTQQPMPTAEPAESISLRKRLARRHVYGSAALRKNIFLDKCRARFAIGNTVVEDFISGATGIPRGRVSVTYTRRSPSLPPYVEKARAAIAEPTPNKKKLYLAGHSLPISDQGGVLKLALGASDYWTSLATQVKQARDRLRHDFEAGEIQLFQAPLQLNLHVVVVTSDNHLVLARRNKEVRYEKLAWSASLGESMDAVQDIEFETSKPHPERTVRRALKEELGISEDASLDINFLALGFEWHYMLYVLFALAHLKEIDSTKVKDFFAFDLRDHEHLYIDTIPMEMTTATIPIPPKTRSTELSEDQSGKEVAHRPLTTRFSGRLTLSDVCRRRLQLLLDVASYPLSATTTRYSRLGLNPRTGNELRVRLVGDQLLKPVRISHGKIRVQLFELTELGRQLLRDHGHNPNQSRRKGGLEHQYCCNQVKTYYEKNGYGVLEEVPIGSGKTVDLVVMKGKERIAIEVETGKSDVVGNIRKCLAGSFTKIVVFATSPQTTPRIQRLLKRNNLVHPSLKILDVGSVLPGSIK